MRPTLVPHRDHWPGGQDPPFAILFHHDAGDNPLHCHFGAVRRMRARNLVVQGKNCDIWLGEADRSFTESDMGTFEKRRVLISEQFLNLCPTVGSSARRIDEVTVVGPV